MGDQKMQAKERACAIGIQGHHQFYSLGIFAGISIYNTPPGVPRLGDSWKEYGKKLVIPEQPPVPEIGLVHTPIQTAPSGLIRAASQRKQSHARRLCRCLALVENQILE